MQASPRPTRAEENVVEGNPQQVEQNVEQVNSLPNMAKEKVTNTLRSSLEKGKNKRQITKLLSSFYANDLM